MTEKGNTRFAEKNPIVCLPFRFHLSLSFFFKFLDFLTAACGMQDLSSPNRDETHGPCR